MIVLVTTASCTALGMLLGSIGLYGKDFFFVANLAYYLLLLFCGVNVPPPRRCRRGWPTSGGASRHARDRGGARGAAGASFADVSGLVATERGIGACYAVAGFLLFRVLEWASRRSAVLDTF